MSSNKVEWPSNLPMGFIFSPTDEEVINHYLKLKIQGKDSLVDPIIPYVPSFCKREPWELTNLSRKISDVDDVWWFFSNLDCKYDGSKLANRQTKTGSWRTYSKDKKIKGLDSRGFIGGKRTFAFRATSDPRNWTGWVMLEYYLEPDKPHPSQRDLVYRLELKLYEQVWKTGISEDSTVRGISDANRDREMSTSNEVKWPLNMPVGFRFSPTDEEIISHYLRLKILGRHSEVDNVIAEVDLYKLDPQKLPDLSKDNSDVDKVLWFFTKLNYSDYNRRTDSRKTETGEWKTRRTEKKIECHGASKGFNGRKMQFNFHRSSSTPGKGIRWVMHEYYPAPDNAFPNEKFYIVCRFKYILDEEGQEEGILDNEKGEPSGEIRPDIENTLMADVVYGTEFKQDEKGQFKPDGQIRPDIEGPVQTLQGHGHNKMNLDYLSQSLYSPASSGVNGTKEIQHMPMVKTPNETHRTSTGDTTTQETDVPEASVVSSMEFKLDEKGQKADTPEYEKGETSGNITRDLERLLVPVANPMKVDVVCGMEFEPDEKGQKAGTPDYEKGETSGNITRDLECLLGPIANPTKQGDNNVNLEYYSSQPLHSPNFRYTNEMGAPISLYDFEDRLREKLANSHNTVDSEEDYDGVIVDNFFNLFNN